MRVSGFMLTALIIASVITLPVAEAHILIVADSLSDSPYMYDEAKKVATTLKNRGYQVLELYRNNATVKNILKGMYGA
ncbi:MAG TPA: lysyl endopeptidase, partial [Methanothermobacter thermautotrophicus]|nr:lysyl endopeptidase [Methanothermobacter thermautotrophicus]